MRKAVLRRLVFAVLLLSCAASVVAQARREAKSEFHILSVGNMNVISSDDCEGLKFLTVLVSKRADKESLERVSKKIASTYRKKIDLFMFFFTSRKAARKVLDVLSEEEEKRWSLAVRGIYSRRKSGSENTVIFLPAGLTEMALAELGPQKDN